LSYPLTHELDIWRCAVRAITMRDGRIIGDALRHPCAAARCEPSSRPGRRGGGRHDVAAVLAMVAVTEGARRRVEEMFEAMASTC